MSRFFISDEAGNLESVRNLEWALWIASSKNRQVALTELAGGATVSTVFLGFDHGYGDDPPALWETMAFDMPDGEHYQERYTSLADARAGHAALVARLTEGE